jgi:hypothetical protein
MASVATATNARRLLIDLMMCDLPCRGELQVGRAQFRASGRAWEGAWRVGRQPLAVGAEPEDILGDARLLAATVEPAANSQQLTANG